MASCSCEYCRVNAGLNSRDRVRRIGLAAVMRRHKRLTEESQC